MKIILLESQVLKLQKRIKDENQKNQFSLYGLVSGNTTPSKENTTGTNSIECKNNHTISSNRFSQNTHHK